jgi:hypothetical protein
MNYVSIGLYGLAAVLLLTGVYFFMRGPSKNATPEEASSASRKNKMIGGILAVMAIGSGVGGYFMGKDKSSSSDDGIELKKSNESLDDEIDSL